MRNQQTERGCSSPETDTDQISSLEGYWASGSGRKVIRSPTIFQDGTKSDRFAAGMSQTWRVKAVSPWWIQLNESQICKGGRRLMHGLPGRHEAFCWEWEPTRLSKIALKGRGISGQGGRIKRVYVSHIPFVVCLGSCFSARFVVVLLLESGTYI